MTPPVLSLLDPVWVDEELDIMEGEAKVAAQKARENAPPHMPIRPGRG